MATETVERLQWELDSLVSFHALSGNGVERYRERLEEVDQLLEVPRRIKEVTPFITLPHLFFQFGDSYSAYKWTQRFLRESWGKVSREGWVAVVWRHVVYASEIGRTGESEFYIQEALHVLAEDAPHRYDLLVQSGKNALRQHDPTRAASRLHSALGMAERVGVDSTEVLLILARAYLAADSLERALDIATFLYSHTMTPETERQVQSLLVETFSRLGRWEKAKGITSRMGCFEDEALLLALCRYHLGLGERARVLGTITRALDRNLFFSPGGMEALVNLVIEIIEKDRGDRTNEAFFLESPIGKLVTDLLEKLVDAHDRYNKAGHGTRSHHTVKRILTVLEKIDTDEIAFATRLHDIGKLLLPESLLNRLQPIDEEDRGVLVEHSARGYDLFRRIGWPEVASHVLNHHERVDGSGYPYAISNPNLVDNLIFLCSSFDSMINSGPMRTTVLPYDDAITLIKEGSGKAYNPLLCKPFLSIAL